MAEALTLAHSAMALDEVPVGAVLVHQGEIIARAHNRRELDHDPVAHAEMLVMREGSQKLGAWRLSGTTLYVTLEPCAMCAGALVNARVDRVVFGCRDPKAGAAGSLMNLCQDPRLNHRLVVDEGLLGEESSTLLKSFFQARRRKSKAATSDEIPFGELAELVEGA